MEGGGEAMNHGDRTGSLDLLETKARDFSRLDISASSRSHICHERDGGSSTG